jgi:ELWxxDGT repeat protein
MVADIRPGTAGSEAQSFTVVGGELLFVADEGTVGAEPWRSDGTAAGTALVKDINAGTGGSFP